MQEDIFDGKYLQIFDSKKGNKLNRNIDDNLKYISKSIISDELENLDSTKSIIKKLFVGEDRHICNLIKKSRKYKNQNFIGCLSWSIPFHNIVDFKIIELAFRELCLDLNLDFDLYIFVSHYYEEHCFIIKHDAKI